jgi:excinuclease UvrABC nuclease subunit
MKKAAENLDFETAQTLKLDIESLNSLQSNQIARD